MSLPYSQLSTQFPTLDYPELTDHSLFDEFFVASLKAGIATEREKFLRSWDESVELERRFVEKSKHSHTRGAATELKVEFQTIRSESYRKTRNSLFSYVYALYENELANPSVGNIALTPERVAESTRALHSYIAGLNGDSVLLDTLIQELGTLQSKNQEFIFKVFVTLHGELLNKQLKQSQQIVDLQSEVTKRTDSARHFESLLATENQLLQAEKAKTDQLLRELLSRDELNTQLTEDILTVRRRLEQSDAGNQTLVEDGEKESEELREQIKDLETKLTNSSASFKDLESKLASYETALDERETTANTLRGDKIVLESNIRDANALINELQAREQVLSRTTSDARCVELELEKTKSHIVDLQDRCEEIESAHNELRSTHETTCTKLDEVRRELDSVSFARTVLENKNRTLTEKINELQFEEETVLPAFFDTHDAELASSVEIETIKDLKATVEDLNSQLRDAKARSTQTDWLLSGLELQVNTAKHNEKRVQESLEQERSKSNELIGEIRSINKIKEELREQTRFCEQNHADYSSCELRAQTYRIKELERENEELRSTMPFDLSRFGAQAGNDDVNLTANVSLKELETSLVKGLGELFTREDKKNIRVFRGKQSDPPITSWLKDAEVTAYLNGWDDEQKVRYFSDRLKDEAAEWLREY